MERSRGGRKEEGEGEGGAVVVRPLELQRNFQVGSSKHVCTGSSVIPEPPTHTFTISNLQNNKDVIVLSQLIPLNKRKGKEREKSYIDIQDDLVRNGAPAELLIVTLMQYLIKTVIYFLCINMNNNYVGSLL